MSSDAIGEAPHDARSYGGSENSRVSLGETLDTLMELTLEIDDDLTMTGNFQGLLAALN